MTRRAFFALALLPWLPKPKPLPRAVLEVPVAPVTAFEALWLRGILQAQAELRAGLGQPYRWGVQG